MKRRAASCTGTLRSGFYCTVTDLNILQGRAYQFKSVLTTQEYIDDMTEHWLAKSARDLDKTVTSHLAIRIKSDAQQKIQQLLDLEEKFEA